MKTFIHTVNYNLLSQIKLWHLLFIMMICSLISYIFSSRILLGMDFFKLKGAVNCWDVFFVSVSGPFDNANIIAWLLWYLPFFLMSLFLGNTSRQELMKMPDHTLLRYKSRIGWWYSKQATIVLISSVYFLFGFSVIIAVSLFYTPFSTGWSQLLIKGNLFVYSECLGHIESTVWFEFNSPFIYLLITLIIYISGISAMLFLQMVLSLKCKHSVTPLLLTNIVYFVATYLITAGSSPASCYRWLPGTQLIISAFIPTPFNTKSVSSGFLRPLFCNILLLLVWGLVGTFIIRRLDIVRVKED